MEYRYIVVMITAPSSAVGERIANTLLEKKLIACANILSPVLSLFTWEEKLNRENEVMLVCKTRLALLDQIIPVVKAIHPYQVPEIIALPLLDGAKDYLDWIEEVTGQ
jgi:periplasmic divalent cation tolerance protein